MIKSFSIPNFRRNFFFGGGHIQTICGAHLPAKRLSATLQFELGLSDGDHLGLHVDVPAARNGKGIGSSSEVFFRTFDGPVVVSVHGLGGCFDSPYLRRLASRATEVGWVSVRMDLRAAGESGKQARGLYHSGRSQDVLDCLHWVRRKFPAAKIALCGFSLGAAISLHLLSHHTQEVAGLLTAAAVACPPIDLRRCTVGIQRGFNRIYDRTFSRSLWNVVQQRPAILAEFADRLPKFRPKTLWDFDDQVTARIGGFQSAADYYDRCSTMGRVHEISLPTLVIAANDDPIIPVDSFSKANWPDQVHLVITQGGGHLGFIGAPGQGNQWPERWLEGAMVSGLRQMID